MTWHDSNSNQTKDHRKSSLNFLKHFISVTKCNFEFLKALQRWLKQDWLKRKWLREVLWRSPDEILMFQELYISCSLFYFKVIFNTEPACVANRSKKMFVWGIYRRLTLTSSCCSHTHFLHLWWEYFILNVLMKKSHCDVHGVHLSLRSCLADAAFCVVWLSMHSCSWFVSFSVRGLLWIYFLL